MTIQLNNLKEAYSFIEENADEKNKNYSFTNALKILLDNTQDEEQKQKIQWEIDCFSFMLVEGDAKPYISGTTEGGKEYSYPSYDSFIEDAYKYLTWRSEQVKNPLLIIRYNQILWNGNSKISKNQKYAKQAIETYYNLLTSKLDSLDDEHQYQFINSFENALFLSTKINYRDSDFKTLWKRLIFNEKPIIGFWKSRLVELALKNKKFKKEDFNNIVGLCLQITCKNVKGENLYENEQILKTALLVGKRRNESLTPIHIALGKNYEASAEQRMNDDSRIVPLTFLMEALEQYQEAKDKDKIEDVAVRIAKLRNELQLSSVPINFDQDKIGPLIDYVRAMAKQILTSKPEAIYSYIASGRDFNIFPRKEWMEKPAKENKVYDLFSTSYIDINNNQTKGNQSEDSNQTKEIYDKYDMYVKLTLNPFLQTLFVEGIKSGKLSYQSFIKFIVKHSWLGQKFSESSGGGKQREYNWVSAIAPAIQEYFLNTKATIFGSNYRPNYLLAIDSITPKFEGILRNFAQLIEVQTIRYSQKNKGTREMYLEEILENPKVQEFFNEDDRILFKYVLLGYGMNLRNNIAHCFFKYPDYNYQQMHLLILCILRLGKYRFESSPSN